MNGLAQAGMQEAQQRPQGQPDQQQIMEMVMKVMELLKQGVTPEQLMQKGVPQEIIQMAMAKLQGGAQPGMEPQQQIRQ